jgi:hypothetical protein
MTMMAISCHRLARRSPLLGVSMMVAQSHSEASQARTGMAVKIWVQNRRPRFGKERFWLERKSSSMEGHNQEEAVAVGASLERRARHPCSCCANHTPQLCTVPCSGEKIWAPHPPLERARGALSR